MAITTMAISMEKETTLIQQLRRTLGRMEAAMAAIHDALAISDGRGRLLWCNEPFLLLCGKKRLECLGRSITSLLPQPLDGGTLIPVQCDQELAAHTGSKISMLSQDPLQVIELQWDPIPDEDPPALVFCVRDISTLISYQELWARSESLQQRSREIEHLNDRLRRTQQHLASQVRECPVTGLPNRRGLMEHLESALAEDPESSGTIAVMFCDLNRFKEVNDVHGHDAGDELLIEISKRLRDATREDDMVSRLGGDEFVIVSHNLQQISQAQDIAERLQRAVGQAWTVGDEIIHPSLSIGIALANADVGIGTTRLSAQELIRRADQAMYAAKGANLLRGKIYDESLARRQEQTNRVLLALRQALARRELTLHLQPIVELRSGAVRGHEALVRLPGLDGVLLSPDHFISQAERSRLIGQLGHQVLEQALSSLKVHDAQGLGLTMAVNVSPLELAEPGYASRVLEACARTDIDPSRLQLEITETAIITQPSVTAETLSILRRAGVCIHLDDFGTGYSSLSLLSELPLDGIKIDRSFTGALGLDRSRTVVIQAITRLCRELGLSVIAEGIETEAQKQRLVALDCDFGQGYLFGPPRPLDDRPADLR
jgi:diguanylate cyclase (GGDEF)-like protein